MANIIVEHRIALDPDTRQFFVDLVRPIFAALNNLENTIMTQFQQLRDDLDGVFADLAAKIDRLQAAVDNPSSETNLSPEDQALLDEIKASVAAARASVGDENADGTPAPPA